MTDVSPPRNAEDFPEPPDSVFHNMKLVKDALKT
ncbi:hypothetical protein PybrP1_003351 [[Pythium] brassicae (nom. inval.)]|nr:hypothetical protein PybrP1_003351 [[Pythium] brassicae (nom. inval.)]